MNVKAVVKVVQTWTEEEWALAAQLRKLGGPSSAAPKPKRKYTRKAKVGKAVAAPAPKAPRAKREAKGNGGSVSDLKFPKVAKPRGRPPGSKNKATAMVPPPEPEQVAEA